MKVKTNKAGRQIQDVELFIPSLRYPHAKKPKIHRRKR